MGEGWGWIDVAKESRIRSWLEGDCQLFFFLFFSTCFSHNWVWGRWALKGQWTETVDKPKFELTGRRGTLAGLTLSTHTLFLEAPLVGSLVCSLIRSLGRETEKSSGLGDWEKKKRTQQTKRNKKLGCQNYRYASYRVPLWPCSGLSLGIFSFFSGDG